MDTPSNTYNPARVAHARRVSGMDQKQLAEALGVSRTAVSGWEATRGLKHARTPSVATLEALAELLLTDRTVDYFFGEGSPL